MSDDIAMGSRREGAFLGIDVSPDEAGVVLIPVPFEATCSYGVGTAEGPAAVLEASGQIDLFDLETGRPDRAGIAWIPEDPQVRAWSAAARALAAPIFPREGPGDDPALLAAAAQVDGYGDRVNAWLGEQVERWLDRGKLVGVVGGDHSVPFASIQAHARRHPGMGVLHLDAHADLRRGYEGFRWSHASIFWNVRELVPEVARIVGIGYRDLCEEEHELIESDPRLRAFYDTRIRRELHDGVPFARVAREVVAALPKKVYLSFDIDGLDPSLCPDTGTPVPGGLSFTEVTAVLRCLVETGHEVVGLDLCEVAPDPTGGSQWNGNVGARLLYKMIGYALRSRTARR